MRSPKEKDTEERAGSLGAGPGQLGSRRGRGALKTDREKLRRNRRSGKSKTRVLCRHDNKGRDCLRKGEHAHVFAGCVLDLTAWRL